jgi:hypothetical protein
MSLRPKARPAPDKRSEAAQTSAANARRKNHMNQVARHYQALGMKNPHAQDHAMMRRAMDDPRPSYTGLRDMFDGGGPGRSGARFSSGNTATFDANRDNYVSENEYLRAEETQPEVYRRAQRGIASLSNFAGARPRGSYASERNLGAEGVNIGTSGIARYITDGGFIGNMMRGGRPSSMSMAVPTMKPGASLTSDLVSASLNPNVNAQGPQYRTDFPGLSFGMTGASLSNDPQSRYDALLELGYSPPVAQEYLLATNDSARNAGMPTIDYSGVFDMSGIAGLPR